MDLGSFGPDGGLLVAVLIGIAFGFALERAGLGSARRLSGQFFFANFAVFRVMFSAVVTALLGAFWLSRLGLLDSSRVYVPETFLAPQLAGGLIFGAGMVLSGLCPGTSCVAAATGRVDGLFVMLGMLSGVLVAGLGFERLQAFQESTPRGALTLPVLLGIPEGFVVAGVVALALVAFRLLDRFERPL